MTDPRCIVGKLIKACSEMQSISSVHMARGCGGVWGGFVVVFFFFRILVDATTFFGSFVLFAN